MTTWPWCRTARMVVERSSSPGVRAVIGVHQSAEVDVGVALRRGEARVAEELLDGAQIGAAAEEVGRKGVAGRVRRGFRGGAARGGGAPPQTGPPPAGEPPAPPRAENRAPGRWPA